MNRDELIKLYKKYDLNENDVFKHAHYTIISRGGIEKIQSKMNIEIKYEIIEIHQTFAVIKATGFIRSTPEIKIETFGSALYGHKEKVDKGDGTFKWMDTGTCTTLYIAEMAEKRAMSRVVLKLTGLYAEGFFGEDEAESFKKKS
jgi:hypothetical protein